MNMAKKRVALYLAQYDTSAQVLHAAEKVRKAGYTKFDAHTPFPVHGMDAAMGLPDSRIGWIVFFSGLTGVSSGLLMMWWMGGVDYPLVVGGKPIVSWTAFGIIMFELTMLFAGVSNFSALIIMSFFTRRRFSKKVRAQMTSERIVLLVPVDGCAEDRKKAIRACLSQALEVQS